MKRGCSIVISPHPDDVALSLGCMLQERYRHTYILNTFTLSKTDIGREEITGLRMAEEQDFAKMAGAQAFFLGEPDSNYRGVPWNYFDKTIRRADMERIVGKYLGVFNEMDKDADIYIPMALGMHPDHVYCYYSALAILPRLQQAPQSICFYEDVPYNAGNRAYLPSQKDIAELGVLEQYAYCRSEKERFLKVYPSQLTHPYIAEILSKTNFEHIRRVPLPVLISKHLCTTDSLAIKDGIRLI